MNTNVFISISIALVSVFCCHGLADKSFLNRGQIEKHSNDVVPYQTLIPMTYMISFFETSIKMLRVPDKLLNKTNNYKFNSNKSTVAPPSLVFGSNYYHYNDNTSTKIPDPNATKRIIRQANMADDLLANTSITKSTHIYNNTMNSTYEHSKEIIDNLLNGTYRRAAYKMIKEHSKEITDNLLNGTYKRAAYKMIKDNINVILIFGWFALLGVSFGILLKLVFVAVRAHRLRKARRELNQQSERVLMYVV